MSFLKWVGGKRRVSAELKRHMPKEFGRYFEPMVGGGALFFELQPRRAVLADMNEDLISTYVEVRDHLGFLVDHLKGYQQEFDSWGLTETYAHVKNSFNSRKIEECRGDDRTLRAAEFIVLNRTGFNGLWRVNKKGSYNVPVGSYENPKVVLQDRLEAAHRALQGVDLRASDFEDSTAEAQKGDFVYFDPPYLPLSPTAHFAAYTEDGFGTLSHMRLAEYAQGLVEKGCYVMISNACCVAARDIYAEYTMFEIQAPRSVSAKGSSRRDVRELILIGGYAPELSGPRAKTSLKVRKPVPVKPPAPRLSDELVGRPLNIGSYAQPGEHVVVAFSGGKDSTAMALLLGEHGIPFSMLYTPTGDELPGVREHIERIRELSGAKLEVLGGETYPDLIRRFGALPNPFMRWCTRILKIERCSAFFASNPGTLLAVGLRADEEKRTGGIWGDVAQSIYPLRDAGFDLDLVTKYLEARKICVPRRTDCARCFYQTPFEWYMLWLEHRALFDEAIQWEKDTGHFFRNPKKPDFLSLNDMAVRFNEGWIPNTRKRAAACWICSS